jgi:NADP-dependent 3-hydroxy acid dehydrogenase YdfG
MSSTTAADVAPLRDRSAVISGASRGIGLACAHALHAAGARVLLVARSADALDRAVRQLGERATSMPCDITDAAARERSLAAIRATVGGSPDILVNNAASFMLTPFHETSLSDFERMIHVNLVAHFAFTREFLPDMRSRRAGHIVTIGSIADKRALSGNAAYAASKFGLRGLHEVLREELRGSGVRATLVSPGRVDTDAWDDISDRERPESFPRAQMLDPMAVAEAVRYAVTRPVEENIDELRLSRS